jgi:glucosylceramidase
MERYPELPVWQTEVCYALPGNFPANGPKVFPVYDFSDGEFWGNMIMNDLKTGVSGWIYWNMILDQKGGPWLVSLAHGDPDNNAQHPVVIINRETKEVSYTGLYYYLSHFSRFIRPGARKVACSTNQGQLNVGAFINQDKSLVLIIINNGNEIEAGIDGQGRSGIYRAPSHSISTIILNK